MSNVRIWLESRGIGELAIRLDRAISPEKRKVALMEIGRMMLRRTRALHAQQRDPWGAAWKPLAPATVRKKGHSRILIDTGRMLSSYSYRVEGDSVRFGPRVPYARFHQFGTARIPRRAVLPLDRSGNVRLPADYRRELEDIIQRVFIRPLQGGST